MNLSLGHNEDLLSVATAHARDVDALCLDVAAIIFPSATHSPSEATISAVSVKLLQIVRDIEVRLAGEAREPKTWPLLVRSGFLRETALVDFAMARVAEDRLDAQLGTGQPAFVTGLLDHPESNVADAAQILLAADSLHLRAQGRTYLNLPPELLHKSCWRVVAALEVSQGERSEDIIKAADILIALYDEARTAPAAARKIVHFLNDDMRGELLDPKRCGVHLFVAQLSATLNLEHDHILRIMDFESAFAFMIILAAMGISKADALRILLDLRSHTLTQREAHVFETSYAGITRQLALDTVASWSASRLSLLTFGLR
ncbi:hypothetical protein [Sphingorhabdus sp.]|uniref:hypothetical protein n=1 Tax=Sphingorhabdus sp. TaxID=1902408 RepID=UPI00391C14E4